MKRRARQKAEKEVIEGVVVSWLLKSISHSLQDFHEAWLNLSRNRKITLVEKGVSRNRKIGVSRNKKIAVSRNRKIGVSRNRKIAVKIGVSRNRKIGVSRNRSK
ncbi:hypothetical protein DPMN_035232 [Dreissena polymorpha]|uniref:Uncharacterized protein n=1 Tax=Dreissena polymorpha TaxID=45954 RepID=A0A9D4MA67_DREPO|nr:hypothetical protein DPMN_035232 [Dreissena polymorpha]